MRLGLLLSLVVLFFVPTLAHAKWTKLDYPGASSTFAKGIQGNNIVGYYYDSHNSPHGFLYDGTTWSTLSGADQALGIDANNIVGETGIRGFLFDGTNYDYLDAPGANVTVAAGISGINIVGHYRDNNFARRGYLYDGTTWTPLDDPSADTSSGKGTQPWGIDGNNIVGDYTEGNFVGHGFLYNGTTWTTLDAPGAVGTVALGIQGNKIVGFYANSTSPHPHAFIYNGTTWTTLDAPFPGAQDTSANGIDGNNIVGYYVDSGNNYHGFLYTNTTASAPEPTTYALLSGFGLTGAIFLRRRK